MNKETIKRNIIFILLIGIEGLAFGLLDWDSVISDLVYLQYNQKTLVSLIAANIGVAKIVATLICIYINDSKKPNKIFIVCVILCAIGSLLIGITYNLGWLILFAIIYVLETLVLEIYSGYHYAYVYNSLPDEIATEVHSKRISIFKITFMIGIGIASFLTTKFMNHTMIIVTISSAIVLLALILPISKVKNCPKNNKEIRVPLKQKLNLRNYTKYYKSWVVTRFLGKFALSSLVVLLSMIAIDSNMDLATLKTFKTGAWFLSSTGFWLSAYLIKNKIIVKGDILCKSAIAILVIISFFCPYAIYAILLLNGLLNPFNTMSNFTMIQMDNDNISVVQKELLINLFGFFSGMLSSYILLNINVNFALILIVITLTLSVMNEIRLYKMKQN
jgi:MFS family permease